MEWALDTSGFGVRPRGRCRIVLARASVPTAQDGVTIAVRCVDRTGNVSFERCLGCTARYASVSDLAVDDSDPLPHGLDANDSDGTCGFIKFALLCWRRYEESAVDSMLDREAIGQFKLELILNLAQMAGEQVAQDFTFEPRFRLNNLDLDAFRTLWCLVDCDLVGFHRRFLTNTQGRIGYLESRVISEVYRGRGQGMPHRRADVAAICCLLSSVRAVSYVAAWQFCDLLSCRNQCNVRFYCANAAVIPFRRGRSKMPTSTQVIHSHGELSVRARIGLLAQDIKLSHSIFALPFALLATFLAAASVDRLPQPLALCLIVLCMVLARTVAMTVNRWADRYVDAHNPRTAGRAIPSGKLSPIFVLATAGICAAAFVIASAGFWLISDNVWPLLLSPAVLAWLMVYSFTKRFTALCHLFLGSALALSPLAAAIAIEPSLLGRAEPYLLAMMVTCWVGGFDIIYALLDVDIDRQAGLYSMPAQIGVEPALWLSRLLHLLALVTLVILSRISSVLGTGFDVGVAIVGGLLVLEHALMWRSQTHHIHVAFFTINGLISVLLGVLGIIDAIQAVV